MQVDDFWKQKEAAAVDKPRHEVRRYARPGEVGPKDEVLIIGPDQQTIKCRVEQSRGLMLSLRVMESKFDDPKVEQFQPALAPYMPGKLLARPFNQCMPLATPSAAAAAAGAAAAEAARPGSQQGSSRSLVELVRRMSSRKVAPEDVVKRASLLGLMKRKAKPSQQRTGITCLQRVDDYSVKEVRLVGLVPEAAAAAGASNLHVAISAASYGDDVARSDVTDQVRTLVSEDGSVLEITVDDKTLGDVEKASKSSRTLRVTVSADAIKLADLDSLSFEAASGATLRIDRRDRAVLRAERGGFFTAPLASLEPSEPPLKERLKIGDELYASPTRDTAFVLCRLLGETDGAGMLVVFTRTAVAGANEHALPQAALRLRAAQGRGERDKWLKLWEKQLKGFATLKGLLGANNAALDGGESVVVEQAIATFKLIDTDRNGELSRDEFFAMLDNFGIELQPEQAARTFETIDKDGNGVTHPSCSCTLLHPLSLPFDPLPGVLSLEEFTDFVQNYRTKSDTNKTEIDMRNLTMPAIGTGD